MFDIFSRKYADPIYSHTQDGTVISGSVRDVIYAIEAGADMRIVDRQLGYGVRMDNLEVSFDRKIAAGQSLWHISERMNGPNLVKYSHRSTQRETYTCIDNLIFAITSNHIGNS